MAHTIDIKFKTDVAYTEGQFAEAHHKIFTVQTSITKGTNSYTVNDVGCLVGGWFFMATGSTVYTIANGITNYVYAKVNLTTDGTNYTATTGNIQVSTSTILDTTTAKYRLIATITNNDTTGANITILYHLHKDLSRYGDYSSILVNSPNVVIPSTSTGYGTKLAFTTNPYIRGNDLYVSAGSIKSRTRGLIDIEFTMGGALTNISATAGSTIKIHLFRNGAYYGSIRNNTYNSNWADGTFTFSQVLTMPNDTWDVYILNFNTGYNLNTEFLRMSMKFYNE